MSLLACFLLYPRYSVYWPVILPSISNCGTSSVLSCYMYIKVTKQLILYIVNTHNYMVCKLFNPNSAPWPLVTTWWMILQCWYCSRESTVLSTTIKFGVLFPPFFNVTVENLCKNTCLLGKMSFHSHDQPT